MSSVFRVEVPLKGFHGIYTYMYTHTFFFHLFIYLYGHIGICGVAQVSGLGI